MNPSCRAWVVAGVLIAGALPLKAAEHITFKNGYDLICDHRVEDGGRVRIYIRSQEDNFLEVDAAEIATVEAVPDPPPLPPAAASLPPAVLTSADLHELMAKAGAQHNLDVDLLASVVRAESGGNVRAVSRAGAQGLMQLMPQTALQLGVADSFRPDQNINGGTAYLDALLTRYHENLAVALAAYNAGPAAVDKYHGIPPYPETRMYVARVIREFNRRKSAEMRNQLAHNNRTPSAQAPHKEPALVAKTVVQPSE
jgi:soluble lytic murein transglycosylase-like protein